MRNWLAKIQPTPWLFKKLVILGMLITVGVSAFFIGRSQMAQATTPPGRIDFEGKLVAANDPTDASRRVVAYLYNKPVSREELGEYLIARFGVDRLEFMLNRKIVEVEAAKCNVFVSDAEVNDRYLRDIRAFGPTMTEESFVNGILRRFNKTLFEWKEDVIRPKLMMEKLVRPKVRQALTERDLHEGFETRYGPKVECRMIVFAKDDRTVDKIVSEARASREAFLTAARNQVVPSLKDSEGKVPAIHHHFGDPSLEDAAFRLKEGEISGKIQMKEGMYAILMCEKHLPADTTKKFEEERAKLMVEVEELRLMQRIPEEFNEMKKRANPQKMLKESSERTAMLQLPTTTSLRESDSGVVPAQSTVVVPPPPLPEPVKPIQQPVSTSSPPEPIAVPKLPSPPPLLNPQIPPASSAPIIVPLPDKK